MYWWIYTVVWNIYGAVVLKREITIKTEYSCPELVCSFNKGNESSQKFGCLYM